MDTLNKAEGVNKILQVKVWTNIEKIAFRFAFIFLFILIVPLEPKWYSRLFSSENFHEFLVTIIAGTRFDSIVKIDSESGTWGLASYASWGLAALIGIIGALIWTVISRYTKEKSYNSLYYWLRVVVRYRIAVGLIAFGLIKFFPTQMPYPSISNLNTIIGDYTPYKLYWQSVGLSYQYEIFLGFLEIAIALLLLFRSTTALGAIITAGVLFNIAHANLAYDGAVHVYSSYFVLLSLFLLIRYFPNIWKLFVKGETVTSFYYYPKYSTNWGQYLYYGTKVIFFFVFLVLFGYYKYDSHYNVGKRKEPVVPGLKNAAGYYAINTFVINGDTLKYSPLDSVRWHDAILESYSTLSFSVNKPQYIDMTNGGTQVGDLMKNYEFTGRAGGRTYLYYESDTVNKELYLVDKNQLFYPRGYNKRFNKQNEANLKELYNDTALRVDLNILKWKYSRPNQQTIILSGADLNRDTINVVLDLRKREYLASKEWYSKSNKYKY